jgi:putative ABC transport system ATP-binding protein
MIAVRNLVHRYNGSRALSLAQWQAAPGERWLVLGPSGCGKSTLLHILAGLVEPSEGEIEVDGKNLKSLRNKDRDHWRGTNVGIVLQALHLVPHLSARDNLRLAQYLGGRPQSDAAVTDALAALGVADKGGRKPFELSQGEQQRVAIARAVVNGPKLLLADEPTASLDDAAAESSVALLFATAERTGATLVVATHDARVKRHFSRTLPL